MKRIFALLLTAALLLVMTACGNEAAQTEATTTVPTEAYTEAQTEDLTELPEETVPEPEFIGIAEQLLQSEDTVTVSFDTTSEYEKAIRELGYTEFVLNYYADVSFTELACKPLRLTYNDKAIRLEFSYTDTLYDTAYGALAPLEEFTLYDGWVMYGTKADAAMNITSLEFSDYEWWHSVDLMDRPWIPDATRALDFCPQIIQTDCYDDDLQMNFTAWAFHSICYYPDTGNLYNFVNVAQSMDRICCNTPRILQEWDEALMEVWDARDLPCFTFVPCRLDGENNIVPSNSRHIYLVNTEAYFEYGMTLKEWTESVYNFDGWSYAEEEIGPVLYAPEKNYVVVIGLDSQGNMYAIDTMRNYGYYEVDMLTYEDYCLLRGEGA